MYILVIRWLCMSFKKSKYIVLKQYGINTQALMIGCVCHSKKVNI